MTGRYRIVIKHPDDPVQIYDTLHPEEPCVATCANADEADAWLQDHMPEAATIEQLFVALLDPSRKLDWYRAVAEAFHPDHQASHRVMDNVAHIVVGAMIESGFPVDTFMRVLRNKVVETDNTIKERLRQDGSIGRLGNWRNDS
jgi:hypothetical protein